MAKQLSITRLRLTTCFVLDKFLGQLKCHVPKNEPFCLCSVLYSNV